jgi:hypothetical protein
MLRQRNILYTVVPLGHAGDTNSWPRRQMGWVISHAPAALYPRERTPGTYWIEGWVGLRAGLDTETRRKILCFCRGSNPRRPVCSQTLSGWATPAPEEYTLRFKNLKLVYPSILFSDTIFQHVVDHKGIVWSRSLCVCVCVCVRACASQPTLSFGLSREFLWQTFDAFWEGGGVFWSGKGWPKASLYLHQIKQHRKTRINIYALKGVWTHDPSVREVKTHSLHSAVIG